MSKVYKFNRVLKETPKVVIANINSMYASDPKITNSNDVNIKEIQLKEIEKKTEDLLSEALKKATDVLQQAKKDADLLLEEANKKAENIYKKAYEEGYIKGVKEGKREGLLQYQSKLEEVVKAQKKLYKEYQNKILNTERELIELSIQIAEKILKKKIEEGEFINLVKHGLEKFTNEETLIIRVCPECYEQLERNKNILYDSVENLSNIKIIKDHSLKTGDCIIESLSGKLNAGISEQLNEIKRGLLGKNLC
ncbi:MAG: flagellar assembly protein FliH [Thermosediminibacterales bacterium]|nr:flagellar assembly protein FliH [Thermosediminibacterales bacterium]